MWSISAKQPVVNKYRLDLSAQSVLDVSKDFDKWLKIVVGYRTRRYNVRLKSDIIYGPIADDRMDQVLQTFLIGRLSSGQLRKALLLVNLGNQYALKKSAIGLEHIGYRILKGLQLQQIITRIQTNKTDIDSKISLIYREAGSGYYVEELTKMGDFVE